jgi:hypothetical protein
MEQRQWAMSAPLESSQVEMLSGQTNTQSRFVLIRAHSRLILAAASSR